MIIKSIRTVYRELETELSFPSLLLMQRGMVFQLELLHVSDNYVAFLRYMKWTGVKADNG